jgi:hypothetical protein
MIKDPDEEIEKLGEETKDRRFPEEALLDEDNIPWPLVWGATIAFVIIAALLWWLIRSSIG